MNLVKTTAFLAACLVITLAGAGCSDDRLPSASFDLAAQGVFTAALSEGSELTLIGSLNHGGSLWRNSGNERLFNWNHKQGEFSQLVAANFSVEGTRAVTADPRTLVVWDTASGAALAFWTTPSAAMDVALGPGGTLVLMGLEDHSAVIFNAETGDHVHTLLHEGVVGSVAISADGRWAVTGSDDETAVLWDLSNGEPVHKLAHDNPVRVVALSASGRMIFTASQNRAVTVWNGADGTPLHRLSKTNTGITSARFSKDERYLLLGYVNRNIELWDAANGRLLESWDAKARNPWHPTGAAIRAVGFSSSPDRFYALAGDGRLLEFRRS